METRLLWQHPGKSQEAPSTLHQAKAVRPWASWDSSILTGENGDGFVDSGGMLQVIMELRTCWNRQREQNTPGHVTSCMAKILEKGSSTNGGWQLGQPCSSPTLLPCRC